MRRAPSSAHVSLTIAALLALGRRLSQLPAIPLDEFRHALAADPAASALVIYPRGATSE